MADDLIRYDILVKDALREVIHKVLLEVSIAGLPGDHHFFVTFLTTAPGVKISSRLKKLYPSQMTIVIQHQFWDLIVNDLQFEINLSFSNIAEKLVVPFAAIQSFYDPQASFEAAFDLPDVAQETSQAPSPITTKSRSSLSNFASGNPTANTEKPNKKAQSENIETTEKTPAASNPARVVSLDDFRKKRD
ncbi:ClpXP protease specificity-enhancing factor SspB [Bartonella sp. TP]|uniref:SspB family protein n=1 Tax=Bartonella sp. TP TaxID=3057550 RepID=UPI0025B262C7|nr:ClpXP protease specificity-enhancing factor SspB [Bartonella sp. TP]WJW79778.1 ClpXP protease specificity-enhancing factor SspB [Bartonella sp. TP]